MTLVKFNQDVVEVIGRNHNEFTVLTREREVKRVPANEVNAVNKIDIQSTLRKLRKNKFVYLPEYRKIKAFSKNTSTA
ncbi:hypothetical protein ACWE42_11270 [Sutcliffiella cohnii]